MKIINDESLLKHPFASMSVQHVESSTGKTHKHLLLQKKDAVCLTIFDTHTQSLLFVEQWRAGAHFNKSLDSDGITLEPVAGHIDPGESPIEAAIREALEETTIEIKPENITFIAKGLTSPGISNEMHYHYFATFDSSKINMESILNKVHGIDDEEIKIKMIPIVEAMDMVSNGYIFASHSIIGVMYSFIKRDN